MYTLYCNVQLAATLTMLLMPSGSGFPMLHGKPAESSARIYLSIGGDYTIAPGSDVHTSSPSRLR